MRRDERAMRAAAASAEKKHDEYRESDARECHASAVVGKN